MGRKRPSKARGLGGAGAEPESPSPSGSSARSKSKRAAKGEATRDVLVEVDGSTRGRDSDSCRDIAELVLRGVRLDGEDKDGVDLRALADEFTSVANRTGCLLRLRVRDAPPEDAFRLGNWPVVPADRVLLEHHAEKFVTVQRETGAGRRNGRQELGGASVVGQGTGLC